MDAPQSVADYPPMQGQDYGWHDGRYRIWTVTEAPYGHFPRYINGGPAMVVLDEFSKSVTCLNHYFSSQSAIDAHDGKVKLNLRRIVGSSETGLSVMEPHELDGTRHATVEDADRAAYEAGCTAYMVYVKDEAKYDL